MDKTFAEESAMALAPDHPRWTAAFLKARKLGGGHLLHRQPDEGDALIWRVNGEHDHYLVTLTPADAECNCQAGSHKAPCYHLAAVLDMLGQNYCRVCGTARVWFHGDTCPGCIEQARNRVLLMADVVLESLLGPHACDGNLEEATLVLGTVEHLLEARYRSKHEDSLHSQVVPGANPAGDRDGEPDHSRV